MIQYFSLFCSITIWPEGGKGKPKLELRRNSWHSYMFSN